MKTADFVGYHAGRYAIDPRRPWQVVTSLGCVVAKLETEAQANAAVLALQADKDAGTLPCNLAAWSKRHLLGCVPQGDTMCELLRDGQRILGPASYNDCWLWLHKRSNGNSVDWLLRHEGFHIRALDLN